MAFSQLRSRVVTGLSLGGGTAVLLIGSAFWPPMRWIVLAVIAALNAIACFEPHRVVSRRLAPVSRGVYVTACVAPFWTTAAVVWRDGLAAPALYSLAFAATVAAVAVSAALIVWGMAIAGRDDSLDEASLMSRDAILPLVVIGWGFGALASLIVAPNGPIAVAWLVIVVATSDIAAYFVGQQLRGPKLSPALSPGKTISGTLGGLVIGTLIGAITAPFVGLPNFSLEAILAAFVLVAAGQAGDLAKSFVKRCHGVKDFGTLLPGHGGVIDRLDGILVAAVVAGALLALAKGGA